MPSPLRLLAPSVSHRHQGGAILIIALMTMVILLISTVAMVRSFDVSQTISGNLAFKRDLINQGERGIAAAIVLLKSGALATETAREANSTANNYSAATLTTNGRGVPNVLISDSAYTTAAFAATDITDSTTGVTIRTVIDRQCTATGAFAASTCVYVPSSSDKGGTNWLKKAGAEYAPVYRISVRVSGPRNTQIFLQSTVVR